MMDITVEDLSLAEQAINALFLTEGTLRLFANNFSIKYILSPSFVIDLVSCLPGLVELTGATQFLGSARTFRVVRLLRLIDPTDKGR